MLIVRVWTESHELPGLRARITQSVDVLEPGETVSTASTIEDVLSTVRNWLEEFVSGSQ